MDPLTLETKSDRELLILLVQSHLDIKKDLYGNGQRGKLSEIFRRLRSLETWKWMLTGALVVACSTAYLKFTGVIR